MVYAAFAVERGARVALKTVRNVTGESIARFKREFRALQDIHHPNLVSLGELISHDDQWFFTMELVEGSDFLGYVRPAEASASTARGSPSAPTIGAGAGALGADAPSAAPISGEWLAPVVKLRPVRRPRPPHGAAFDEERLRSTVRQLASALSAVHGLPASFTATSSRRRRPRQGTGAAEWSFSTSAS